MKSTLTKKNKIGLGTAQFGLDYGLSNPGGRVPEQEVRKILHTAWNSGVNLLDTAAAYGTSEEVLGKTIEPDYRFQIVTKVPSIPSELGANEVETFIRRTFERSLRRLRTNSVYSLMFHNADDLLSETGNEAYATLRALKDEGFIEKIGVSAYTQAQLEAVARRFDYDLVQVPINALDQRLMQSAYLTELHDKGVEIHARSVFLQGLLLQPPDELDSYFDPVRSKLREFHAEDKRHGATPLKLALTYVNGIDTISQVVIGVTRETELREVLDTVREPISAEFEQFAVNDEAIINPALWPAKL